MDGADLKKALGRVRERGRGRYPSELRNAVVEYSSRAKRQGKSHSKVAAELGMCLQTLSYWRAMAQRQGALTPVSIVAEPVKTRDLVVELGPLRVRGFDVDGLAELFKRLG